MVLMHELAGHKMYMPKDEAILRLLRANSRLSVVKIAKKLGMPRTTVYERIKALKKLGVIQRYTCVLNFNHLRYMINALVLFKLDAADKLKFGEALTRCSHTNTVFKLGNEFDYMASFFFPSISEMNSYFDSMTNKFGIKDYKILYTAKNLKEEGFLTTSI